MEATKHNWLFEEEFHVGLTGTTYSKTSRNDKSYKLVRKPATIAASNQEGKTDHLVYLGVYRILLKWISEVIRQMD
jgi:hypothetical protein